MPCDRRDLRRRLYALAASQGGYFTAAQARDQGYSYQAQHYHARVGNWLRVDRALYRLPEWPVEQHDELVRWTLWSGGRAVVSHATALAVHQLGEFESGQVHLTVPQDFGKHDDALVLHRAEVPNQDIAEGAGFRLTTPLRSLIDVAGTGPDEDQLGRAIAEALKRGVLTAKRLRQRAEEVDARSALYVERALTTGAS